MLEFMLGRPLMNGKQKRYTSATEGACRGRALAPDAERGRTLVRKTYKTGVKITDAQMRELRITPNDVMPKWNYTIEPM